MNLRHCNIDDNIMKLVVLILDLTNVFESVDLTNNEFTDTGFQLIKQVFKRKDKWDSICGYGLDGGECGYFKKINGERVRSSFEKFFYPDRDLNDDDNVVNENYKGRDYDYKQPVDFYKIDQQFDGRLLGFEVANNVRFQKNARPVIIRFHGTYEWIYDEHKGNNIETAIPHEQFRDISPVVYPKRAYTEQDQQNNPTDSVNEWTNAIKMLADELKHNDIVNE
eukprot:g6903.t1